MSWRVSIGFVLAVSSSAVFQASSPARADDAYLCGPDTIVYVAVADLEMKKRTDPCIAGYYGLTVEKAVATTATAEPAAQKPTVVHKAVPNSAPELKPQDEAEIPSRLARKFERQASLEPPHAMPGTDFRNVRVLNAATPDAAVFHHSK